MGPARLGPLPRAAAVSVLLHGAAAAALLFMVPAALPPALPAPVVVDVAFVPAAPPAPPAPQPPAAEPAAAAAPDSPPSAAAADPPLAAPVSEPPQPMRAEAPRPVAPRPAPRQAWHAAVPHPAPVRATPVPVAAALPSPATASLGVAAGTAGPSSAWLQALDAWIDTHLDYPEESRRRGEEGSVLVRFTVAHDGRLVAFSLLRGSGYDDLDNAARALFRDAHLPAAPLPGDPAEITLSKPVRFVLR